MKVSREVTVKIDWKQFGKVLREAKEKGLDVVTLKPYYDDQDELNTDVAVALDRLFEIIHPTKRYYEAEPRKVYDHHNR